MCALTLDKEDNRRPLPLELNFPSYVTLLLYFNDF